MNDSVLNELKALVDRAVRPVRATFARKRGMREELLAHLTEIYDEEAARLRDEHAALERAKERFGNPEELTTQLQQAVPRVDRCWSVLENVGYRPSESAWRLAARHFLVMLLIYSLLLPIGMALTTNWDFRPTAEVQRLIAFILVGAVLLVALWNVILSIVLAPLLGKIGPALVSKRRGRILLAVLCGFIVLGGLLPAFTGAAVLFLLMARQAARQWRYDSAWA